MEGGGAKPGAWLLGVFFFQFFGSISYWLIARPAIAATADFPEREKVSQNVLILAFVVAVLILLVGYVISYRVSF